MLSLSSQVPAEDPTESSLRVTMCHLQCVRLDLLTGFVSERISSMRDGLVTCSNSEMKEKKGS